MRHDQHVWLLQRARHLGSGAMLMYICAWKEHTSHGLASKSQNTAMTPFGYVTATTKLSEVGLGIASHRQHRVGPKITSLPKTSNISLD